MGVGHVRVSWGVFVCCCVSQLDNGWPKSLCAPLHFGTKGNRDSIHLCLLIHCNPVQTWMYNCWFTPHIQPWRFLWRRILILNLTFQNSRTSLFHWFTLFFFWAVLKNFVACDRIVKKKLHLFRFSPKFQNSFASWQLLAFIPFRLRFLIFRFAAKNVSRHFLVYSRALL